MSEFSEQLDWTLDGTDTSVISAETTNGTITLECSARDKVIVRAFKQVRGTYLKRGEICEESSGSG